MVDYRKIALAIFEGEKQRAPHMKPSITRVLITHQGKTYLGGFHEIAPGFSKEIVYLAKTTKPILEELAAAIKECDPSRPCLIADEELDISGRGHALRRVGSRLTWLTPEQTEYVVKHPPSVIEI